MATKEGQRTELAALLQKYVAPQASRRTSTTILARRWGISRGYAASLLEGKKSPGVLLALRMLADLKPHGDDIVRFIVLTELDKVFSAVGQVLRLAGYDSILAARSGLLWTGEATQQDVNCIRKVTAKAISYTITALKNEKKHEKRNGATRSQYEKLRGSLIQWQERLRDRNAEAALDCDLQFHKLILEISKQGLAKTEDRKAYAEEVRAAGDALDKFDFRYRDVFQRRSADTQMWLRPGEYGAPFEGWILTLHKHLLRALDEGDEARAQELFQHHCEWLWDERLLDFAL